MRERANGSAVGISLHAGTGFADHTFIRMILFHPFATVLPFLYLRISAKHVLCAFWAPGASSDEYKQHSSDKCCGGKSREESWAVGLGAQGFSGRAGWQSRPALLDEA